MLQNIDKELVPIKAHYFLYNAGKFNQNFNYSTLILEISYVIYYYLFAATGPIVPFLPTIAKQLGFSATLVGTIYTVLPISGLISKPLFGGLADKFKLHKIFFLIFQVVLTVAFMSISYIPKIDSSAIVTFICNKNIPYLEICPEKTFSDQALDAVTSSKHVSSICQVYIN